METREVRIEYVDLDDVRRWPRNPKEHSEEIGVSIERFGFVEPLILDERTGRIVAGHGRLETLSKMRGCRKPCPIGIVEENGAWKVPVIRGVAFSSDREAEAYLLASNRLTEAGGWDQAGLLAMLSDVQADVPGLDGIGWDSHDLDALQALVEEDSSASEAGSTDEGVSNDDQTDYRSRMATLVAKWGVTKGQTWILGKHRLACGTCCDGDVLKRLLRGDLVSLLVTDPPYGVSYAEKNAFLNAISRGNCIQEPIENDHMSAEEMSSFWRKAFGSVRSVMGEGASYYVTGPQGGDLLLLLLALRESGFPLRHMLVWAKNNHVLGRSDYHYKHEPIIFGWVEGSHRFFGPPGETSLWEIDRPHKSDLHPTMKPVELFKRAIRNSSSHREIVLDPFVGSGTCVIACEETGRACRAVDIDPVCVAVTIQRWVDATSGSPRLE